MPKYKTQRTCGFGEEDGIALARAKHPRIGLAVAQHDRMLGFQPDESEFQGKFKITGT